MIKLIIEDDEGKTTVVPLIRDEISIGRKEGNTIRLTERNVSRRHARLMKSNGAVFIEDLASYNGIKVNGNKISGRVAVTEGDRIQIGDYVLGLKVEGGALAGRRATEETPQLEPEPIPKLREPKPEVTTPARLVVISVNFSGMEFPLDKPAMVVGRTDDNDIVISHRSISRHHARIVEENGRYTIVDLQSANGVRVNGEEYGKVELRRGDLIDLGHVTLRFVAPGEDFIFERDATIVETDEGVGISGVWLSVAVVALLALGFLVWRLVGSSSSAGEEAASPTKRAAKAVGTADRAKLLANIEGAIANETWDVALAACAKLDADAKLTAQPDCLRAKREQRWKQTFEGAIAKSTRLDYVEALQMFNRIPDESVYAAKREANPSFKEARSKYLAQMLQAIDDHVSAGECDLARVKAETVRKLVPDDVEATPKAESCAPMEAAVVPPTAPRPRPHPPRPRPVKPKPKTKINIQPPTSIAEEIPTAAEIQQSKDWLQQAREAYVAGHHAKAISLANKVLKVRPAFSEAVQILGASACLTQNARLARSAYRRLDAGKRRMLKQVCARNGVAVE